MATEVGYLALLVIFFIIAVRDSVGVGQDVSYLLAGHAGAAAGVEVHRRCNTPPCQFIAANLPQRGTRAKQVALIVHAKV